MTVCSEKEGMCTASGVAIKRMKSSKNYSGKAVDLIKNDSTIEHSCVYRITSFDPKRLLLFGKDQGNLEHICSRMSSEEDARTFGRDC